jgi:short-subunit dehydrogenase
LARQLQAQGWHTALLDLEISGLEDGEAQSAFAVDLTDRTRLAEAVGAIRASHASIDLVIYNAGITHIGPCDRLAEETHRKVFEINHFAAAHLAQIMLQPLRESRGTHLAISSVAGFSPLYHRTAYAASKHALEGFFASLRSEEAVHGVKTLIAAPSFVATNIGNDQRAADGTARPGSASDGVDYMTPDAAASAILRGLERGRPFIPVGRVARLAWWINALSPQMFQSLMERRIRDAGRD